MLMLMLTYNEFCRELYSKGELLSIRIPIFNPNISPDEEIFFKSSEKSASTVGVGSVFLMNPKNRVFGFKYPFILRKPR